MIRRFVRRWLSDVGTHHAVLCSCDDFRTAAAVDSFRLVEEIPENRRARGAGDVEVEGLHQYCGGRGKGQTMNVMRNGKMECISCMRMCMSTVAHS